MSQTNSNSETTYPTEGPSDHPTEWPTEWINMGDASPEGHGGAWVKWDGSMWIVVKNRNLRVDGPEGMIQDGEHQMIEDHYVGPQDVWIDGDPDNGFTDGFKSSISGRMREPTHTRDMEYIAGEIAHGWRFENCHHPSYTDDLGSYLSDRFGIELD